MEVRQAMGESKETAVLDLAPLTEAFGDLGGEAQAMLTLFLHSIHPLLDSVTSSLKSGEITVAADAAHAAKGAANVTGAWRLGRVCEVVERAARAGDVASAAKAAELFPQAMAELEAEIGVILGRR